jgi:hypothetical protein
MTSRLIALCAMAGAAALLAGCGKQVALERPGTTYAQAATDAQGNPVVPPSPHTSADTQTAREAAARAARDEANSNADPEAPQSTGDLRRMEDAPITPARGNPIGGTNDPNVAPPQGAIPDPLNHPEGTPY